MTRNVTIAAIVIVAFVVGVLLGRGWPTGAGPEQNEREVLYWEAPMDPNFRSDKPGKSPMGMDLVPVYADEAQASDPALVSIDPSISSNLGVRSEPAEFGPLSRVIDTVGYVSLDEDTVHHVHTRVDGWVENLSITASGDPVTEGQVLFELYSPALVNAQEEYLAVLRSSDSALRSASRARLAALGVMPDEIRRLDAERKVSQRIRIRARSDGFVTHLGIRDGMYVTPDIELLAIANLDQVWVQAEVFERQAAWVEAGQRAAVELDYLPGETLTGVVDYVYPELDPVTRTLKARLRFDNTTMQLRPNMFASVKIFGTPTAPVVHVPAEALIRGGRVDRIVLADGEGRFRSQPVTVGIETDGRVEIRSGLSPYDRVVTSGQFLIDSESNIESALKRLGTADAMNSSHHQGMENGDQDSMHDVEHDGMDHGEHESMNHADHNAMDHDAMDHSAHDGEEAK